MKRRYVQYEQDQPWDVAQVLVDGVEVCAYCGSSDRFTHICWACDMEYCSNDCRGIRYSYGGRYSTGNTPCQLCEDES